MAVRSAVAGEARDAPPGHFEMEPRVQHRPRSRHAVQDGAAGDIVDVDPDMRRMAEMRHPDAVAALWTVGALPAELGGGRVTHHPRDLAQPLRRHDRKKVATELLE